MTEQYRQMDKIQSYIPRIPQIITQKSPQPSAGKKKLTARNNVFLKNREQLK